MTLNHSLVQKIGNAIKEVSRNKGSTWWYTPHMAAASRAITERIPLVDILFEVRDSRLLNFLQARVRELPKIGHGDQTITLILFGIPNVGMFSPANSLHQIGRISAAENGRLKHAVASPRPGETKNISGLKVLISYLVLSSSAFDQESCELEDLEFFSGFLWLVYQPCASVATSSVSFSSTSSFLTSPAAAVSSPASAVVSFPASSFHSPAASCSTSSLSAFNTQHCFLECSHTLMKILGNEVPTASLEVLGESSSPMYTPTRLPPKSPSLSLSSFEVRTVTRSNSFFEDVILNLIRIWLKRNHVIHLRLTNSRDDVLKKEETINQLTNDLQECMKELGIVKEILPKVFQERDFMWEEVKSYREMNMLLNYEINMLKTKLFIQSDWNLGASLYGFKLLKSRVVVLFVAGTSREFLICFGVHYWYFGHCISYAVLASVLLGAAVSRHLSVTDSLAARRDALQSTGIRLREGFRRKDQNSSASSSEGTWNRIEEINSDKSIHRGRPSLDLRSSSCRSAVQEPEVGSSYVDRSIEHNSSLLVCSSSALEAKARSSLDADREHRNSNPPVTDSNDVEDVLPNHISFSEELRLQGLGKWLQHCRVMLHHVAGTPERAWLLFSLIFILETVVVAIFRPKTIKLLNATHQQKPLLLFGTPM
ncbi:Calpain-type cysteine protease DEK1 [Capsicum baccatum]|uniref:Calpain-type cysteine protease DEK1 n=1 Tax=Capsicum baccatum TaxID=33114 RepID=A0A2G2XIS6_CAPBA|nr:Calpain-type cysteine protease DEK1 [Capsicum baccatum]